MNSQNSSLSIPIADTSNDWSRHCSYVTSNPGYFENPIYVEETKSDSISISVRTPAKNPATNDMLQLNQKSSITAPTNCHFSFETLDFNQILMSDHVIVDKTLLIKKLFRVCEHAILITRPRKWGKTWNMKMLKAFLQPQKDNSGNLINETLFIAKRKNIINESCTDLEPKQLAIATAKKGAYIEKYAGKVPVIFMTFEHIEYKNNDNLRSAMHLSFWKVISNAFKEHVNVYNELKENQIKDFCTLVEIELKTFEEYLCYNPKLDLDHSITFLSYFLKDYYNNEVCIIIDDWDAPFNNLSNEDAYRIVVNEMNSLLQSWIKDNSKVRKAIIAGILGNRISGMFSGWNSYVGDNVIHSKYNYFGFTDQEVNSLLAQCYVWRTEKELALFKTNINSWYGGYTIERIKFYNPFSIISCLRAKIENNNAKIDDILQLYWINTEKNSILESLIEIFSGTENCIKLMVTGYLKLYKELEITVKLSDAQKEEQTFFSLLLHYGYLTFAKTIKKCRGANRHWIYIIPNQEVKNYICEILLKSLLEKIKHSRPDLDLNSLVSRLNENLENSEGYYKIIKNEILNSRDITNQEIDIRAIPVGACFFAKIFDQNQKHNLWNEQANEYRCKPDALYIPIKNQSTTVVLHKYKKICNYFMEYIDCKVLEATKKIYERLYMNFALFYYENDSYYSYFTNIIIRVVVFFKLEYKGKWNLKIIEFNHNIDDAIKINNRFKNDNSMIRNCKTKEELEALFSNILSNCEIKDKDEEGMQTVDELEVMNIVNQEFPIKRDNPINMGRNTRSRRNN